MGNASSERSAQTHRRESRGAKDGARPKILMDSTEDGDIFQADDAKPVVTSKSGTVNNIIQVKKTDFEVFDALKTDSEKCADMSEAHIREALRVTERLLSTTREFLAWQRDLESDSKAPPEERPTVFRWTGPAKDVYLSGSFNNWASKIPLSKSHSNFVAIVDLPEGEHQYKFYVDGNWTLDPKQPVVTSKSGTVNNIIQVKKTDFEVFDALKTDSEKCADMSDMSGSPPGSYHQEPYSTKSEDRLRSPPILPPHLLQVLLNKDTGVSCDPALLPEPNHVMLNHLYALSIKDGVMVLSATHRYKKKYVTTLLYKPI